MPEETEAHDQSLAPTPQPARCRTDRRKIGSDCGTGWAPSGMPSGECVATVTREVMVNGSGVCEGVSV